MKLIAVGVAQGSLPMRTLITMGSTSAVTEDANRTAPASAETAAAAKL